jgi:hypothetical protein
VQNDNRVTYARLTQEFAFHFIRLDTSPADFDLASRAAEMFEGSVTPPTAQIAGTEETPAVGRICQK